MALISSSIPNFVNGVSQQPFTLRLASQGEAQVNGYSTVSQGLKKRPPTQHIKKVLSTPISDCYLHTINRDNSERYVVAILDGDLRVFDLDGNEKTVSFPNGKTYLDVAGAASKQFSVISIADYTFIVNKEKVVAMAGTTSPSRPYEALVNVKSGNYGKSYKVILNGSVAAEYTTPDGGSASHSANIDTSYIAAQLYNDLVSSTQTTANISYSSGNSYSLPSGATQANFIKVQVRQYTETVDDGMGGTTYDWGAWTDFEKTWTGTSTFSISGNPGQSNGVNPEVRVIYTGSSSNPWNVQRIGSTLYLSKSSDFSITTEDGFNGNAMVAIKGNIQSFSDLPDLAVDGFVVEVTGDGSEAFDNYWVEYDSSGSGVWRESIEPGLPIALNAATMPHVLIRNSDGTFTFKQATWENRKVGDAESNPLNTFVGTTIADIFFYRNRLGLLADEAVIFSEAGNYWNFFRTTVTTLLDGDPIDVTASATKVTFLKHAVQFNKQLLLFSDQTQFLVDVQDLLTPKTIALKMTTEFPCNVDCKPVAAGRNVYFTVTKGEHAAVREFYADVNNFTNDALDITAHVPQYIDGPIYKIAAGTNEDVMVLLSSGERHSMYIYKYFWANNEKLQSSWSEWYLPTTDTILGAEFIQSELYLFINRADGLYFEKMNFAVNHQTDGEPYQVKLDRKKLLPGSALTYSNGYTYINLTTLGYSPNDGEYQAVIQTDQAKKAGEILDVEWTGSQARIKGNFSGNAVSVGRKYNFRYQLSTITVKTAQIGGGQKSDTEGRLQLRKVAFNYDTTGFFTVNVTPLARDTYTYTFSGKVLGTSSSTIGAYSITNGRLIVPVISRNIGTTITVENDSPLPCSILSADWEGYYVKRSQQV